MTGAKQRRVLFVCTGNAGRSQLAQAVFRQRVADNMGVAVESAGVAPWRRLHPMAVKLMREMGVEVSAHHPKPVTAVASKAFELVVTVGDPARRQLPLRMAGNPYRVHWDIDDPADADGTPDSESVFRATLEQIERHIPELSAQLDRLHQPASLCHQPGINSGIWAYQVLSESHIALAADAGFHAIEISPFKHPEHFDFRSTEQIQRIRRAADDHGLAVWSLHSRDVGDMTSPDARVRQAQLDHLHWCMDAADALGATAVVSHLQVVGKHFADLPAAESRLADAMNALQPRAEASTARIALENGYARKPGQWARDMFRRVAPFSPAAFGYVIDTGHANIAGDLDDIEADVGERLTSLHLNDNDGQNDIHLVGGEGTVDWPRIVRLLQTTAYDGCLMWEIGTSDEPFDRTILGETMAGHRRLMPASL